MDLHNLCFSITTICYRPAKSKYIRIPQDSLYTFFYRNCLSLTLRLFLFIVYNELTLLLGNTLLLNRFAMRMLDRLKFL
jgi:hypothetical protein